MNLKSFRAPSMAEALALVKRDLGKDAVILNTRSTRVGGLFGFFARTVVEVTASDQGALLPQRAVPSTAQAATSRVGAAQYGASGASLGPARPNRDRPAREPEVPAALTKNRVPFFSAPAVEHDPLAALFPKQAPSRPVSAQRTPAEAMIASDTSRSRTETALRGSADVGVAAGRPNITLESGPASAIERELSAIRLMVSQVLQASPPSLPGVADRFGPTKGASEPLFEQYLRLLESQMARSIAEEVVGKVRDELNPGELTDASIVRTTVLRHLEDLLPTGDAPPKQKPTAGCRPHVIALVGPTGVGKTTTTAKLAAAFKLRHGRSVALITTDTYRIAAVDQLRTYANIIGLPLKIVMTPEEMSSAIEELTAFEIVLIDTAGRSQHNTDRLNELGEFLKAAKPDETHLVLSCASSEQVLLKTVEAFALARPNRILFSKLDEAVNLGLIINVLRVIGERFGLIPVSYVTTGQEVPDHIEPGRPDRLARMILDNRLAGAGGGQCERGSGESATRDSYGSTVQAVGA